MKASLLTSFLVLLTVTGLSTGQGQQSGLVVHEWGTFTCLQDEQGNAIGGINTDDEPVPDFVHRLDSRLLLAPTEIPQVLIKGAPRCHPDVTMRLETPVIYFYPAPLHIKALPLLNVQVKFRGGWLTEFYPGADAVASGLDSKNPKGKFRDMARDQPGTSGKYGRITPETIGSLTWKKLKVGASGALPETEDPVWLAPREVKAAVVQNPRGEREKYLFYRGLGKVDAPFKVARDLTTSQLRVDLGGKSIPPMWLVEIAEDGSCAYSTQHHVEFKLAPGALRPLVDSTFTAERFRAENQGKLRAEMLEALVAGGLFQDEAEAMLNTWQHAYFQTPGLRLMYICDREYVDRVLPLTISKPCEVQRVLVGRIEIVTPRQRELLEKIAAGPAPELKAVQERLYGSNAAFLADPKNVQLWMDIVEGKEPVEKLGVELPDLYLAYLQLGRFRNALVLDEQRQRPTPELLKFIQLNDLVGYEPE